MREAAVVGVPDGLLGEAVRAYVVVDQPEPDRPKAIDERAIKAWCTTRLENFMVPKEVVLCAELPKTTTGKIAKQGLGQPRRAADGDGGPGAA